MKKIIKGTCECYNTGGNCFCGYCQFEDGTWFAGAVNEFGGIWDTEANAKEPWKDLLQEAQKSQVEARHGELKQHLRP